MKKKLLPISLLCLVGMILAGCGGSKSSNSQAPVSSSGEPSSVVPSSSSVTPVPSSSSVAPSTSSVAPSSSSSSTPSSSSAPSSSSSSVAPQPVAVTRVALDKTASNVILGQTLQLTATVSPENADNKEVTWSSSDEDVATVSRTGLVTAEGIGEATITVKTRDGNKTATCVITVVKEIEKIEITNKSAFEGFIVDDMESINVDVTPADNVTALLAAGALKATSSDPTVASIVGLTVTALKVGTTKITVQLFGKEDSFDLTVGDAIPGEKHTVAAAFEKAIVQAPWNGKAGAGSNITETCFELTGKVLAVSPNGTTGVDIILDDGTQAVYLQFTKAADEVFPVAVGDYATVVCKFTNYYGLFEGVSRKAEDEKTSPKIPLKDIVKVDAPENPVTPFLNACEEMDAAAYEAYYNVCKVNGTKDDLNATYTSMKHAKLAITYKDDPSNSNFKYVIDGTNGKYGLEIYQSDLKDEPFEGQRSTVEVYLISANTGKSKSNSILIEQTPLAVESVVLDQEAQTIVHGTTLEMSYTTTPAGSYSRDVTWTSSDETVATVDAKGVVTGVYTGEGTKAANIKVKLGSGENAKEAAAVEISVFGEDVAATAVELNKSELNLVEGQKDKLVATTTPVMVSDLAQWSSSNEAAVKVDQKGNIVAVAPGTSDVTVKYNETVSAKCTVTVEKMTALNHYDGASVEIVGKLMFKSGKTAIVDDGTAALWAYGTANIVPAVNDLVKVTGTAVNYKNNGGLEIDSAKVEKVEEGTVTPTEVAPLTEAEAAAYIAAFKTSNKNVVPHRHVSLRTGIIGGSGNYLTWQYGDALMETSVTTGGMEVGYMYDVEGYLINFYKSGNDVYLCMAILNATRVQIAPTGVSLDKNYLSLEAGAEATLKASFAPAGADRTVTWATSDAAVATVADGKVTAVANGTATITVTAGTVTDSCIVTVGAGSGQQAAEPYVLDGAVAGTGNSYAGNNTATQGGIDWVINGNLTTNPWRMGGKGLDGVNRRAYSQTALKDNINKIEIEFGTAADITVNSMRVDVYSTAELAAAGAAGDVATFAPTFAASSTVSVQKADSASWANCFYGITLNVTNPDTKNNKFVQLKKVTFTPEAGGETPVELANPCGSYSGYLVMPTQQGDLNVFTNIALGDELAYVEVYFGDKNENNLKVQTTYAYDKTTGLVTIVLGGIYGNLTAFYDVANNKLTQVGVHGSAGALLSNNFTAELVAAANFMNCDGTTAELQAIFKRRYGDPWTVDTGNADRFTSVDTGVSGKGMKVRAWTGGRYAINFNADFGEGITVSNVGFWVYNDSAKDVTLRMWYYTSTGLSGAGETGSVVAKAGGWTYCRMGFGSKKIYNFQIADFGKTGVALVFDNICLF